MSRHTVFTIELTLVAPILTRASGSVRFGMDSAMLRDDQERPALPGSLVKGNLRHAWEALRQFASPSDTKNIDAALAKLGEPSPTGKNDVPMRGSLSFADYWSDVSWPGKNRDGRRYRIAVDPKTGAAANGALQVIESPYPAGTAVAFSGKITGQISPEERDTLRRLLVKGLYYASAVGALKGVGFGRVERVRATCADADIELASELAPVPEQIAKATRIGLRIQPLEAFCFAQPALGRRNHFETNTAIPGGALVASIRRRIDENPQRWPTLAKVLHKLFLTQATPVVRGQRERPVALPLSVVQVGEEFHDICGSANWCLIEGQAPLFSVDWKQKDRERAFALLNPASGRGPTKRLRLRNEIDEKTGIAKENVLFSLETVLPEGFDWLANCDLSQTGDPAAVVRELSDLMIRPLTHLGKTKTNARVHLEPAFEFGVAAPLAELNSGDQVRLYLQTPARLLPTGFAAPSTNGGAKLKNAYADAWGQLSDNSLNLSHFYASQRLYGGDYWWRRFRLPDGKQTGVYHPEVLTEAGSLFVFDANEPDTATCKLRHWANLGLDQLPDAPGREDWRHNPWIAANGYGEITVNLDLSKVLGVQTNG